ncbi:MAG: hypothetical protein IKQ37_02905 [Bacteroidaceae bacterium]|nr:hypothetical protein [Bacteroidaceae bacterium]
MKKKLLSLFAALAMAATVSAQVTYTCTAGTNFDGGEGVTKLFDGNENTKFCGNCGNDVYALVTASEPVYVWGYDMTTANDNETYDRCVGKWQLFGTNDATVGANPDAEGWVTLSDLGRNEMVQRKNFYTQRFFCEKGVNKPFKYFKLVLNERKKYRENDADRYDGMIQLSEFKLLGEVNRVVSYKWKASSQDNSKKAVDLLLGQKWEGSNLAGNWVTIETGDGQAYAVKSYSFSTHDDGSWNNRAPKSWKIEGSNDNSTWTLIDERTDDDEIENANFKTFEFMPNNTTDKFRYIKLTLNAMKSTGWTQVGEFHVLSTSDVSDAQYYTNLVNAAKATKTEYETVLGENDPWCQEYATFFAGLDLDGVLDAAISSGEYEALEAKLAEAENNAIAQAMNQFVNGANYAAFAGSADKCWGDGHYSQLVDGKEATKWGGNNFPQYVIYRVKAAFKPFFYKLVTGNDTATQNGRNWRTWNVYGGNFESFSAAADSSSAGWTLIDERVDISEEYLPMKNFYPATFDFNKGVSEDYLYYMVKVVAPHAGAQQQMSEMYLCTQEEFEAIRQPLVEELAEFAAGLDALVVESSMESKKTDFATLYEELKTTADAVRLTKVYNDLVALKEALLYSSAFATGGFRVLDGNTGTATSGEGFAKLLDGDVNTKWCGTIPAATDTETGGSYVTFKTYAANAFNQYMLVTGNDTKNTGRNWKTWKIYGANVKGDMDEMAVRDFANWTLIDEKTDIGPDRLPADNFAPAYFSFTNPKGYKYYKIEVEEAYSGTLMQMSEFKMLSDDEFAEIRQGFVTELTNMVMPLAGQFAALEIPDELKNEIMTTAQAKVNALATASADDLLPAYNDALNYVSVEVPAIVAQAQLPELVDGVYQLSTATHVASFATLVNTGTNDAKAVLMNDIDLSKAITNGAWTSIGTNDVPFKGEFDGQGYTIKNITYTATGQYNGLFGKLSTGAVVKNFTAEGTMTVSTGVTGRAVALIAAAGDGGVLIQNINSKMNYLNQLAGAQVGGVLGGALNGNTTVVDRCTYSGTLDGNDAGGSGNYGGLVGYANNNDACYLTISNCLFDGKLINSAATPGNCTFGGMIGYSNGAHVTIKDVLSIGTVQSPVAAQFFGAVKSTRSSINNSYYQGANVNGSASTVTLTGAAEVTDEQLKSSEIVLALGIAWRQDLGTDAYPAPNATKPVVVKITDAGYATLFVDNADITVPAGVTAYIAEGEQTWLKLSDIGGTIPTATPVILKGAPAIYEFVVPGTEPTIPDGALGLYGDEVDGSEALVKSFVEPIENNILTGAAEDIEAIGKYVLAQPEGMDVCFYQAESGIIKAGKAYLELADYPYEVKAFYFLFPGEDPTGINAIENAQLTVDGVIYNIAGQRIQKMQKGINIVNGKKVLK